MKFLNLVLLLMVICFGCSTSAPAQSRPRRVKPADTLLGPEPQPTKTDKNAPLLDVQPAKPVGSAPVSSDTTHAFQLFQNKQYAAAAKEAKEIAASDSTNMEAWKIAGFSELSLKQYMDASADLQKALQLQRAANKEDSHTVDALAESYVLAEDYERALPLLVTATTRAGSTPDSTFLYYRGLAEFKTGKTAQAEKSFNSVIKADPKNSASLFYLGRIAYERKDMDGAIIMLNRATASDARLVDAWTLLTYAYLNRGAATNGFVILYGQALMRAQQYARAATVLEPVAAKPDAKGATLYLLGVAQSRAKNFPKAITALERAALKSSDDPNIYRELGYAYEVSKQYAKALAAYEKGGALAPNDADFKESIDRVKPFAKS